MEAAIEDITQPGFTRVQQKNSLANHKIFARHNFRKGKEKPTILQPFIVITLLGY